MGKWEHRTKILQMNDGGISVLVKWDTSLTKENVLLNDCRKFDVKNSSQRKRKSTEVFALMAEEEFVHEPSLTKQKSTHELAPMAGEEIVDKLQPVDKPICADGQVKNIFLNPDNFSDVCTRRYCQSLAHVEMIHRRTGFILEPGSF